MAAMREGKHYRQILAQLPADQRARVIETLHAREHLPRAQRRLLDLLEATNPERRNGRLSRSQCMIVGLIRDGLDSQEIADELMVSRYVIRSRLRDIAQVLTGNPRGARMWELPALADERGACEGVTR